MIRACVRTRGVVAVAAGLLLAGTGCVHSKHHVSAAPPIAVPPPGAVPRELDKVALPEYVIEPPDVLRIEAVIRVAGDKPDGKDKDKGNGNGKDAGKEFSREREPGEKPDPGAGGPTGNDQLRGLPLQSVWGEYQVRPDGTVFLGVYGSVPVAGYTVSQAAAAIRQALAKQAFADAGGVKPENLLVILDVTQYNSKRYYVITDGGGNGEQVMPLPITGSETVLDAIGNIGGLSPVSSKRNIWVARRCPQPGMPEQILPVDWVGITQHGVAATNYQIMPGDRVYVKAQRLVTIDTTIARIVSPVERLFGVTLLGASTVNQIQGRGFGFGQ